MVVGDLVVAGGLVVVGGLGPLIRILGLVARGREGCNVRFSMGLVLLSWLNASLLGPWLLLVEQEGNASWLEYIRSMIVLFLLLRASSTSLALALAVSAALLASA